MMPSREAWNKFLLQNSFLTLNQDKFFRNSETLPVELSRVEVNPCSREVRFVKETPTAGTFRLPRPGPVLELTQNPFRLPECLCLSFSQIPGVQNQFARNIVFGIIWIVPSIQVVVVVVVVVVFVVVLVVVVILVVFVLVFVV